MRLVPTWKNEAYLHVMERLHAEGFVAYAVGGCVRDALLGFTPNDVDVATNARPHDLPKVFGTKPWDGDNAMRTTDDGVALYPTGVAHGTWTVRVGDDTVEVTTFRRDVDTDGRRAVVKFADTIEVDALRRDFTMNALYLDRQFNVQDPTGQGVYDLYQGVVRFVGNAEERLREDQLRAMRLFRFHARFGRGSMNRDAWEAASRHRMGLVEHVSKERIWDELKKTLALHSPAEAVWEMNATGVLENVLGFKTSTLDAFSRVLCNERRYNLKPNWVWRYTALVMDGGVPFPASNAEKKSVTSAADALDAWDDKPMGQAAMSNKFGPDAATFVCLVRELPYSGSDVDRGALKSMPLTAKDLMGRGVEPGPTMGKLLATAKAFWYSTDLRATKEHLLTVVFDELVHTDGS